MKAQGLPCHICGQPIDYQLPFDDPMAFVIDEIIPVSRWRQFGYESPEAVAKDPGNVAPAHRICNAKKGNKIGYKPRKPLQARQCVSDGIW